MKNQIVEIETYRYSKDEVNFAGTLRNEKKFELLQKVFIKSEGKIYEGIVRGIELPPTSNPDYTYLIQIPGQLRDPEKGDVSRQCDGIFSTIAEAKASALKHLEHLHSLNLENIERFFKQYENQ